MSSRVLESMGSTAQALDTTSPAVRPGCIGGSWDFARPTCFVSESQDTAAAAASGEIPTASTRPANQSADVLAIRSASLLPRDSVPGHSFGRLGPGVERRHVSVPTQGSIPPRRGPRDVMKQHARITPLHADYFPPPHLPPMPNWPGPEPTGRPAATAGGRPAVRVCCHCLQSRSFSYQQLEQPTQNGEKPIHRRTCESRKGGREYQFRARQHNLNALTGGLSVGPAARLINWFWKRTLRSRQSKPFV